MKRSWIVGGWLFALLASAIPALWMAIDLARRAVERHRPEEGRPDGHQNRLDDLASAESRPVRHPVRFAGAAVAGP